MAGYKEKLAKAKASLMLEHPYIGALAATMEMREDPRTLTSRSDGNVLRYNPEYFDKAPTEEILFALANGAMHAMLQHERRKQGRVGRLWQAATDIAVNALLVKNGFALPPYAYYDRRFDGMYAEEIYAVLKEEMRHNDDHPDEGDPSSHASEEKTSKPNDTKRRRREEDISEPMSHLETLFDEDDSSLQDEAWRYEAIFRKYADEEALPQGMQLLAPHFYRHTIDWRTELYRYIADHIKSGYRFVPPNAKHLYRGIVLPGTVSETLRTVIAVDVSGSIDESLMRRFVGEVEAIFHGFGHYHIDFLTADDRVRFARSFESGEALSYPLEGGGGTDFRPVFSWVRQNAQDTRLLIYFTDGRGRFPDEIPPYDTLWVMPETIDVPFGDVVAIEG